MSSPSAHPTTLQRELFKRFEVLGYNCFGADLNFSFIVFGFLTLAGLRNKGCGECNSHH